MNKKFAIGIAGVFVAIGAAIAVSQSNISKVTANSKPQFEAIQPKQSLQKQKETIDGLPVRRRTGDIITVANIDELIEKSEIIAIGRTEKSIGEAKATIPRDSEGFIYAPFSEVPFKVLKVFKGDKKLKEIRVGQTAAVVQEGDRQFVLVFDSYMPMEPNQKYVLFLQKGIPGSPGEDLYFSTSVMFGQHNLENNREEEAFGDPTFKQIRKAVKERFKE
jgi:hypothetical protein